MTYQRTEFDRRPSHANARRKLRAAIDAPIRGLVESLENRLHLTVSTGTNGFVTVTPSSNSRLIYVSNAGSDSNNGLSPSTPVASITRAYGLLRNGDPDWILFQRGGTFAGGFTYFADSGQDAQDPMVITDYGDPTLPRPVIDAGAGEAFRTGSYNHDIDIIGIAFTSSTHTPGSPNYTGAGNYGLYDLGGTTDMTVEDCSFSYFTSDITFTDYYAPMYNITVYGNEILDSYATSGHSEGLYADTTTNLTIENNVFDHDGWNASVVGGGASIYNQDCYLHSSNVNEVVENNIFADAGSFGLQARAGGIVDNNFFIGDPYGWSFGLVNGATTTAGGVSGQAIGNVVIEPRVDNANGWGIGAMIGNLAPGGGTVISNNIFADEPTGSQPAIILEPGVGVSNPTQAVGLNSVTLSNNIVYDWGFGLQLSNLYVPGTTGQYGLTSTVIKNNDFQDNVTGRIINQGPVYDPRFEDWSGNVYSSSTAPTSSWFTLAGTATSLASWTANIEPTAVSQVIPFTNPTQTIESYMGSQGLTATLAAFMAGADGQTAANWNPVYLASTVNSYIESGFVVDSTAPVAVAIPPADVTDSNYQTVPAPTFTVTYSDAVAVNTSTISSSNVTVTGGGGYVLPVTLVSTSGSGQSITATYQVVAPKGDWTTVPDGTYIVALAGGQIANSAKLTTPAQTLASFNVAIAVQNSPTQPATTPTNLAAIAGTSNIGLSWSDPAADQSSFILTRATDAGFTQNVTNFPLTADATSYGDNTAVVGQTYYYELTAVNSAGPSAPDVAASGATIFPPAPAFSRVILNDGNSARTAIYSASLIFTQPVTVTAADVSLTKTSNASVVATTVSNSTGDGKTWVLSWTSSLPNNPLPDGTYSLTVHGGLIADAYGQTVGGDTTKVITSAVGPIVTNASYFYSAPPHSVSLTFSQDVSGSLSASSLSVTNSSSVSQPVASFAWNAATLTGTWTFGGALADGSYTAKLSAATVSNSDGVHLDGNGDGIPGDSYTYSFTEVKPTIASIAGAANVNVNAPYALTLGAITDAGQSAPTYLIHWGDNTTSTAGSATTLYHTYLTARGATTISVDVLDANGTHSSISTLSLSVNQPTVALSGNTYANPNAPYALTFGTATDTGFTASSYIVHWGDGSQNTYSIATLAAAGNVETHTYSNATSATISQFITVDLVDNSGTGGASFTNLAAATQALTVNAYPTVALSGLANANLTGTYTLNIGAISDPGFIVSQLSVNWGDGTPAVILSPTTTQLTHVFTTGAPGTDNIAVALSDNSGGGPYANAGVQNITLNPTPTVALSGNSGANVNVPYALTIAPAVDPGQSGLSYTINWGDGTASTVTPTPGVFNHTYNAAINTTITVDLTDSEGTYLAAGSLAIPVIVHPTVALSGSALANAGGLYTLTLGAVNDPDGTPTDYVINWGDGTPTTTVLSTGNVTHPYTTTGPATITVNMDDAVGSFTNDGSLPITVQPAPTIAARGNANANATGTYSLNLGAISDAGYGVSNVSVNWGDGTSSNASANSTPTHVYSTANSYGISVSLTDSTGTFIGATQSVTVNPPPTIALSGAPTVTPGTAYALTLGAVVDTGYVPVKYTVHWGDNSSSTYTSTGVVTHTYSAAVTANISVDITDPTGTYVGAGLLAVNVATPPTLTLTGNSAANVNGLYSLTLGTVHDSNGTPSSYVINWGDSTPVTTVATTGVVTHPYMTTGPENITVILNDASGSWNVKSLPVNVQGDPTIAVSGNSNANATGTYTLNLGAVTDPGYAVSTVVVNWGDGSTSTSAANASPTHVYATPNAVENISVSLTDTTGTYTGATLNGTGNVAQTVIVNPQPTIALGGAPTTLVGKAYALTLGPVADTGYVPVKYTVHWGDNSTSTYAARGVVTHTYTTAAHATISVDLTDATGTFAAAGTLPILAIIPPTLTLTGSADANIGGLYKLTLGSLKDPNGTPTQYVINWGDGQSTTTTNIVAAFTHPYTSAGAVAITVDITDPAGTFTAIASHAVTVNPAPTIKLTGAATATTGVSYALTLAAPSDPGYSVTGYTVHWGDGTTTTTNVSGVLHHTYTAAQAPTAVTVDLKDATGTYTSAGSLKIGVYPPNLFSTSGDIGSPKTKGTATYALGIYTVSGAGTGLVNTAATDQFHYDSASISGNKTIAAQITGIQNVTTNSQAGVMIRASTAATAAFADIVVTSGGALSFQWRTATGGKISQYSISGQPAPVKVKLVRTGNVFAAWYIPAGTAIWTQLGANETIAMSPTATAGLVVSSLNTATTATATFANVTLG